MKVDTPQILWNPEGDSGKNAPLYSIDILQSGLTEDSLMHDSTKQKKYDNVLVTAGNSSALNLWKIEFDHPSDSSKLSSSSLSSPAAASQQHKIEYMTSLTRHELPVNCVRFSPNGLHLATAGEAGCIIIWSVPLQFRGNGNGRHFWSTVQKESQLTVKIVSTHAEGICDLSWSADSKRIVLGTIDACVMVVEDKSAAVNATHPDTHQIDSEWKVVHRNGTDHTQFVQGVSYDPLGVYLVSMSSDRTVRLHARKTPPKSKKKVLRPANSAAGPFPPQEHARMVDQLLTDSKMEFGMKSKCLKYTKLASKDGENTGSSKQKLFCDESTCESFFRRPTWTPDGAFLVTPAALWQSGADEAPKFSTYLFARHRWDEPYKVLCGLEKPSVAVRSSPLLFDLPETMEKESSPAKENSYHSTQAGGLAHRSVFCVLTLDTILVYDSFHTEPLAIAKGLHYAGLTDCCWAADGHHLLVCSTDGYLTIVTFGSGELGRPQTPVEKSTTTTTVAAPTSSPIQPPAQAALPPCEPGKATIAGPPEKRQKPNPASEENTPPTPLSNSKRDPPSPEMVGEAVDKLSLDHSTSTQQQQHPKKKKRIQPVLLSTSLA